MQYINQSPLVLQEAPVIKIKRCPQNGELRNDHKSKKYSTQTKKSGIRFKNEKRQVNKERIKNQKDRSDTTWLA